MRTILQQYRVPMRQVFVFARSTVVASMLIGAVAAPRRTVAQGTAIDSLSAALGSSSMPNREAALSRILQNYSTLPPALSSAIVALIGREAATPAAGNGSEDYGEYIVELVTAATRTGDHGVIPSLVAIGGLGVSSGVMAFVASAGPSIIPTLDSLQRVSPSDGSAVLQTFALMYAQQGALLTATDSAGLLSRLVGAASSTDLATRAELPSLALRIPLPELVPLLLQLATSDTAQFLPESIYPVRLAAQAAVDTLSTVWSALSSADLLKALIREQVAACAGASGSLRGHCQSMSAHLNEVGSHIHDANTNPALNELKSFRKALQQAGSGLPLLNAALMDGNAIKLASLIGG